MLMEPGQQHKGSFRKEQRSVPVQTEADWAPERRAACPSAGGPEVSTGTRDSQTNFKKAVKCGGSASILG